jgi:hypothetical protein
VLREYSHPLKVADRNSFSVGLISSSGVYHGPWVLESILLNPILPAIKKSALVCHEKRMDIQDQINCVATPNED